MNIKKFSELTHVSAYTLRYYEKIGVLRHVARNASGHRFFTDKDIDWIGFVKRLKEMGMPLENIKKYADLREQGDATSMLRKKLLEDHVVMVEEKIQLESLHLGKMKAKIAYYDDLIAHQIKD